MTSHTETDAGRDPATADQRPSTAPEPETRSADGLADEAPPASASTAEVAAAAEPSPPPSDARLREAFTHRAAEPEPLVAAPDPRLLEVLVCPVTRGMLEYDKAAHELVSRSAKLAYPIRDGIPIMLPEEARALTDADA